MTIAQRVKPTDSQQATWKGWQRSMTVRQTLCQPPPPLFHLHVWSLWSPEVSLWAHTGSQWREKLSPVSNQTKLAPAWRKKTPGCYVSILRCLWKKYWAVYQTLDNWRMYQRGRNKVVIPSLPTVSVNKISVTEALWLQQWSTLVKDYARTSQFLWCIWVQMWIHWYKKHIHIYMSSQITVSHMMHHHDSVKVPLDPLIYKVLFMCIVLLFPLEITEDISAGHFCIEPVEIRAHVLKGGSLSSL